MVYFTILISLKLLNEGSKKRPLKVKWQIFHMRVWYLYFPQRELKFTQKGIHNNSNLILRWYNQINDQKLKKLAIHYHDVFLSMSILFFYNETINEVATKILSKNNWLCRKDFFSVSESNWDENQNFHLDFRMTF